VLSELYVTGTQNVQKQGQRLTQRHLQTFVTVDFLKDVRSFENFTFELKFYLSLQAIRAAMTSEGVSRPKVEVWCGASDDEVYDSVSPFRTQLLQESLMFKLWAPYSVLSPSFPL
jgi:hypothetical protein